MRTRSFDQRPFSGFVGQAKQIGHRIADVKRFAVGQHLDENEKNEFRVTFEADF